MPVTISAYNHFARLVASGANIAADTYKLKLLTAATFDASHTTLAATGGTEATTGTGYLATGQALTGVTINTVTTNDAAFDANDVVWTASGGQISARYAILYNDTDVNDPPLLFIDFGEVKTSDDGIEFKVIWPATGIFTVSVT